MRGRSCYSCCVRETLGVINQMQRDGVIGKYAIGGAVGAMFYLEPFTTADIDVFLTLPVLPGSKIISLRTIYDYLLERGCEADGLYIRIGDWPVQFLNPTNDLEYEAIDEAARMTIEGVEARVMPPEYLVAICLSTGRLKDKYRIVSFLQQKAVNLEKLRRLLGRHRLTKQWQQFEDSQWFQEAFGEEKPNPHDPGNLKAQHRKALRELPPTKKVRVIEQLRDLALAATRARALR